MRLIIRLGSVRLPLICIDGTRTCSAALHFLRRCTKTLDDWFGSKEQQFFWRGIHKLSNRWKKCIATDAIHRIKYFLSFSCNKRVFSIKKFRFHIYISHWPHHWFRNTSILEPWRISKYFVVFILWSILWDFLTAKILQHLRSTYAQVASVNAFDILFFSICCLIRTQWNAHCNITLA